MLEIKGEEQMTKFFVHDENSLSNLLVTELFYKSKFLDLIKSVEWYKLKPELPKSIISMEIHHQLNLSEFGKPDVVISIIDNEEKKYIFIIEAKIDTYQNSCDTDNKETFDIKRGTSSAINNQLTLRYRAFNSLDSINEKNNGFLTENNDEICKSKFYKDDKVRRCKKLATITVLKEMNENMYGFFLITLTGDEKNPFNGEHVHPLFEYENDGKDKLKGLGSIYWNKCKDLFRNNDESIFLHAYNKFFKENKNEVKNQRSLLKDEIEDEDEEGKKFGRGVKMIYSEKLNPDTFLHFSWDGNSAALRDYSNENINPDKDVQRDKTTTEIEDKIEKQNSGIKHESRMNKTYWIELTRELNFKLLKKK